MLSRLRMPLDNGSVEMRRNALRDADAFERVPTTCIQILTLPSPVISISSDSQQTRSGRSSGGGGTSRAEPSEPRRSRSADPVHPDLGWTRSPGGGDRGDVGSTGVCRIEKTTSATGLHGCRATALGGSGSPGDSASTPVEFIILGSDSSTLFTPAQQPTPPTTVV